MSSFDSAMLRALRMTYLEHHGEEFLQSFGSEEKTARQVMKTYVSKEWHERKRLSLERRLAAAHLGDFKHISEFDWSWPRQINRSLIEKLMQLSFLSRKENIVFYGSIGIGKTMLAKNIAYLAATHGKTARFVTASELIMVLRDASKSGKLRSLVMRYCKFDLLVIDELGYLTFDSKAADLLYQIVHRRHERSSTIVTTNQPFAAWPQIFGNASCVVALIDRLCHRVSLVEIDADSFRLKESQMFQKGEKSDGRDKRNLRDKSP